MPERDPDDVLDLLAYFHYAIGACAGMLALVPAVYLFVSATLADPAVEATVRADATHALRFAAVAFALFALLCGLGICSLLVAAGRFLQSRRRWAFCRAASIVGCLFIPLGTILGAITLEILTRPGVREQFR